jgi:hypothetical protein
MFHLFAYVDPGTGSFALQAVIGSLMGVSFMARNRIRMLVGKFKRNNGDTEKSASKE